MIFQKMYKIYVFSRFQNTLTQVRNEKFHLLENNLVAVAPPPPPPFTISGIIDGVDTMNPNTIDL